jgi:hypothetical protein
MLQNDIAFLKKLHTQKMLLLLFVCSGRQIFAALTKGLTKAGASTT